VLAEINELIKKKAPEGSAAPSYSYEIEINDYPQKARWKVTNKVQVVENVM
jgi:ATP-dependent RNA helicase DDX46/PRP5